MRHASVNVGCQGKSGPGKIHEVILVIIIIIIIMSIIIINCQHKRTDSKVPLVNLINILSNHDLSNNFRLFVSLYFLVFY